VLCVCDVFVKWGREQGPGIGAAGGCRYLFTFSNIPVSHHNYSMISFSRLCVVSNRNDTAGIFSVYDTFDLPNFNGGWLVG